MIREYRNVRFIGRVIIDVFLAYVRFCRWQAYSQWQGRYFEFQGQQVRICLNDDVVWFSQADISILLDPPPTRRELVALAEQRATIPGLSLPGITETGALRLLELRNHRRTSRQMLLLRRWMIHEVIPNIRRNPSGSM